MRMDFLRAALSIPPSSAPGHIGVFHVLDLALLVQHGGVAIPSHSQGGNVAGIDVIQECHHIRAGNFNELMGPEIPAYVFADSHVLAALHVVILKNVLIHETEEQITGEMKWKFMIQRFYDATEMTAEMADAFIESMKLHEDGSLEIKLSYMDEFAALMNTCERLRKEVA